MSSTKLLQKLRNGRNPNLAHQDQAQRLLQQSSRIVPSQETRAKWFAQRGERRIQLQGILNQTMRLLANTFLTIRFIYYTI